MSVTTGSPNVFADLGFDDETAANLKIRADLMLDLRRAIQERDWTPEQAAAEWGEPVSQIQALMQGEIDRFTVDELIAMLSRAGMNVRVEVSRAAA